MFPANVILTEEAIIRLRRAEIAARKAAPIDYDAEDRAYEAHKRNWLNDREADKAERDFQRDHFFNRGAGGRS